MPGRLVYDSDQGSLECPRCRKRMDKCRCPDVSNEEPSGDGIVRVRREVRRGKPVTVVLGLTGELRELARELKKRTGGGGSAKDGRIELQGDHREVVVAALEARGHTVRRAGG